MIRRKDIIKVLFIGVCICHVCPAHPCGSNPMRFLNSFAQSNGLDSATMLEFMKNHTPAEYRALMFEYRGYLDCTQMVQNGYFKRSVDHELRRPNILPSPFKDAVKLHKRRQHLKDDSKYFKIHNKRGDYFVKKSEDQSKPDSVFRPLKDRLLQILPKYKSSTTLNTILKRNLDNLLSDELRNPQDVEPIISERWNSIADLIRKR